MGTEPIRFYFLSMIILFTDLVETDRRVITLNGLLTDQYSPSIHLALEQINNQRFIIDKRLRFVLNSRDGFADCDVGTSVKIFFDMLNESSSNVNILFTDTCQNVLSYISEIATHMKLSVISFTDSDLSLLAKDRYPYFYHIFPSDHSHNLVRLQLLQQFNWTRFGLIYQHGSKYTLVANDFSHLISNVKKQFQVNLTRGVAYRHGSEWKEDNARYMKILFKEITKRDIRIIIGNFNQTLAAHVFCHAAHENVYGSRYQWIILGYPSSEPWWNQPNDCSAQQLVRAINGTLQTRVPQVSLDSKNNENQSSALRDYLKRFAQPERNYFDAYAYDTIWTLAYFYAKQYQSNQSNTDKFRQTIETIDFLGATGRVRYRDGGRIGEVLVEQYVACRMMINGSCLPPCYEEEEQCGLTVVKVFLGNHLDANSTEPFLYPINPIMWHGRGPPRDRTNQTIEFKHVHLSVFISISVCCSIGLIVSCGFLGFNVHFRIHRYIRMSSPSLNNIILGGCMCAYLSIILMGINSSLFSNEILLNTVCPMRVWILCIGFTLAFGSMFGKTWRVHSIFTNINMTKKGIQDYRLVVMVGLLLLIDLVFLTSWQIFDPIHRQLVQDAPYHLKFNQDVEIFPLREECRSRHMSLWFVVLILYKGLLMFYGLFLSWKTRHVKIPALNDSRYIGLSVYVVFICSTLGSLVIFFPDDQIQLSYFFTSFFLGVCTTATVCLVFVPKVVEVYRDPHSRKKQPRATCPLQSNSRRRTLLTKSHLQTILMENQHFKFVLSMQEQTIDRLVDQCNEIEQGKVFHSNEIAPIEFERLIVTNVDDPEEISDDESSSTNVYTWRNKGERVGRAVSLCLLNRIHWPDRMTISRYSIPQQIERFRSKTIFNESLRNSNELFFHRAQLKTTRPSDRTDILFNETATPIDQLDLQRSKETDLISSFQQ